jgi:hypothetical protein
VKDGIVVTTFRRGDVLGERAVRDFEQRWPCDVRVVYDPPLIEVPDPPWLARKKEKRHGELRRFLPKASVIASIRELSGGQRFAYWVDADVVTFKPIPEGFLPGLLEGEPLAFFGRTGYTAETGFIGFDLEAKVMDEFLSTYRSIYESGAVYRLRKWWDTHVFDAARERLGLFERNLCPGWEGGGHPWCHSPLAQYTDHLKGARKQQGFSPEHPLHRGGPW